VWWGGTGDPHLQAPEEQLTEVYRSPNLDQLHDWARKQAEQSGCRTVGIYAGALGFGYNTELLSRKKLATPACWADLVKAEYRGEIQIANPNSSGTAYTAVATVVQIMGEEKAFEFLKQLHRNVNQYPRSGTAPIKAVGRGETGVSISFMHDRITEAVAGFPVKVVATFVLLVAQGLALLGAFRGDVFVASAVAVVLLLVTLFTVFPLARVLVSAVQTRSNEFSVTALGSRILAEKIWSVGCLFGGSRCAWPGTPCSWCCSRRRGPQRSGWPLR
jgi:Bacterial extracellular solute-binding protein